MKKLLATILALVMALSLCTVSWAAETQDVAEAGGTKYESLQDAINAADGQTVKLLDNVTVVGSVAVNTKRLSTVHIMTSCRRL